MGSEWPRVVISDVCELIVDCVNKTAPVVEGPTPFKMIRTPNVKNGVVSTDSCRFVELDTFKKWTRRAEVKVGDVLLTREAPLGEVGIITSEENLFLGQRLMQYRADPRKLDDKFLLYSFLSHDLQHQFSLHEGSGSVVSHIRVGDCLKFELNLPSLIEQKRISGMLGSIDQKIQLNQKTNQTLEQMAQALFKSWFVDFDPVIDNALEAGNKIPEPLKKKAERRAAMRAQQKAQSAPATQEAQQGAVQTTLHTPLQTQSHATKPAHSHANNSTVNNGTTNTDTDQVSDLLTQGLPENLRALFPSEFEETDELGWVPKGWEATSLGEHTNLSTGPSFKSKDFLDEGVKLARGDNVKEGYFHWGKKTRYWDADDQTVIKHKLLAGDVLIGMDGSKVGKNRVRVTASDLPCLLVQRVACLRPKNTISGGFIYLLINSQRFRDYVEIIKTGSAIPHISGGQIKDFSLILPADPDSLVSRQFNEIVDSLYRRIDSNIMEAKTLSSLRDTLLPKLISGELRLPEMDTTPDHSEASA